MLLAFGRRPPAGPGYRRRSCPGSASTEELTVGQGPARQPRRFQVPMLGDPVQPPMLRDRSRRVLSLVIGASALPTPHSRLGDRWGFGPSAPPGCLFFLSGSNGPGKPLRAKTRIYNLPLLAPPTLQKWEPPRGQVFRFRVPIGSCARARRPRQWAHGHGACVGAPPLTPPPKGRGISRGAPRRLPPWHWPWDPGARF